MKKLFSSLPLFFNRKSAIVAGWAVVALVVSLSAGDAMLYLSDDSEDMEHVSAVIRNYFLIVAGVAAFIFTAIRVRQTDKQISQENAQIQIAKTDADGRVGERVRESFQQAVAMLYGEEDATKPFAIEQIKRVALDFPSQHMYQAISLLCGFARKNSPLPMIPNEGDEVSIQEERVFELVLKCLDVIFELSSKFEELEKRPAPIDLRKTYLGNRVITGVTLTVEAIGGIGFGDIEFRNCTFTGKFSPPKVEDYEIQGGIGCWTLNGAEFVKSKFVRATFDNVDFRGVVFAECTAEFSTWVACDFSQSTFDTLEIIGNYGQLNGPSSRAVLFERCDMSNVTFTHMEGVTSSIQSDAKDVRHDYQATDFSECFIRSRDESVLDFDVSCFPPVGLEYNIPPLKVIVGGEIKPGRSGITVKNRDTHTP